MSEDLFSYGSAAARSTDPDTSTDAAVRIRGSRANAKEMAALNILRQNPDGLTSHEITDAIGENWGSITPRLKPLMKKGLIEDSGLRRKSPLGVKCIVWRAIQ
tara:strand:- start:1295 stop:1603 length:309 start_codon:yes stop_codon:yes gene_type:complete